MIPHENNDRRVPGIFLNGLNEFTDPFIGLQNIIQIGLHMIVVVLTEYGRLAFQVSSPVIIKRRMWHQDMRIYKAGAGAFLRRLLFSQFNDLIIIFQGLINEFSREPVKLETTRIKPPADITLESGKQCSVGD